MRSAVQSHRLTPSAFEGQQTLDWEVTVTGGVAGGSFRNGAGDRVQAWTVAGPLQKITVSVRGTVETQDCAGLLGGHRESVPPEVYLRDTPAMAVDAALEALARGVAGHDRLDKAHAQVVAGAIAYRPGATHAHTTAAEALALAEGLCQDHAHALIACARVHGIPARYVSGHLLAAQDGTPHEAAHAWAELHVPGLGWVRFDPANRCCPDPRYIRLGLGGGAPEGLDVRVAVLSGAQ